MTNKTCKNCQLHKPVGEFSLSASNRGGYATLCKPCVVIKNTLYWQTPYGRISYIRNGQKTSSKARGHALPTYTQNELFDWTVGNNLFALCATWEESGFSKDLAPSIDRKDVTIGYSFENIRLVTWKDNNEAQYADRKSCKVITRQNRSVEQLSLSGELIAVHKSIAAAARATGAVRTNINCMCSGTNPAIKSVSGFLWRYAEKEQTHGSSDPSNPERP